MKPEACYAEGHPVLTALPQGRAGSCRQRLVVGEVSGLGSTSCGFKALTRDSPLLPNTLRFEPPGSSSSLLPGTRPAASCGLGRAWLQALPLPCAYSDRNHPEKEQRRWARRSRR